MRLRDLAASYLKSGIYSFGASANEVLHEQLVEKRRYLSDEEYMQLMSLGALVPGPFHVNLVIATGYNIAGKRGALLAIGAFIFPGFVLAVAVITSLQAVFATGLGTEFHRIGAGMLAAVAGLVLSVTLKLARKNLVSTRDKVLTLAIAGLLFFTRLPFIAVILTAGTAFLLAAMIRAWRHR
ncbi:MAG: chromate transporter [Spirochaetota bacterium]